METFDVFINHRNKDRALAGMVYMYLQGKGVRPFWDRHSIPQVKAQAYIEEAVKNTPVFLCVLTKGALDNINPSNVNDVYYRELELAFESNKKIISIFVGDTGDAKEKKAVFPDSLPYKIDGIRNCEYYSIDDKLEHFFDVMEKLWEQDLNELSIFDWKNRIIADGHTLVASRKRIENVYATPAFQYGAELVNSAENNTIFTGQQIIKSIHMACAAANMAFLPESHMIDKFSNDGGRLAKIFRMLLNDKDFSFEAITNAPYSPATLDQINTGKFGSTALEHNPQAAFFGTYGRVYDLITNDPIYQTAFNEGRFKYFVTESMMPFSVLQIIYKSQWEKYNHVKIDFYSEGIASTQDRRSMIIFEQDDKENYDFFVQHYNHLRDYQKSNLLKEQHHDKWIQLWRDFQTN